MLRLRQAPAQSSPGCFGISRATSTERKHLTSLLKMVAYQAESDLVRQIAPHNARAEDEGPHAGPDSAQFGGRH